MAQLVPPKTRNANNLKAKTSEVCPRKFFIPIYHTENKEVLSPTEIKPTPQPPRRRVIHQDGGGSGIPTCLIRCVLHCMASRQTCDSFHAIRATGPVSYTHLRAHETRHDLVCRLL